MELWNKQKHKLRTEIKYWKFYNMSSDMWLKKLFWNVSLRKISGLDLPTSPSIIFIYIIILHTHLLLFGDLNLCRIKVWILWNFQNSNVQLSFGNNCDRISLPSPTAYIIVTQCVTYLNITPLLYPRVTLFK